MRITRFSLLSLTLLAFMISACDSAPKLTKGLFIKRLEAFVDKTDKEALTYKEADWDRVNADFDNLIKVEYPKYKEAMTPEERQQVDSLIGRYYAIVVKAQTGEVGEKLKNFLKQADGFIKEMTK